jgi:heme exporter protein A
LRHPYIAVTEQMPLTISITAGDCIWIKGDNGAGKSTLLKLLAGVLPIESGQLDICASFSYLGAELGMKMHTTLADHLQFIAALGVSNTDELAHLPKRRELGDFSSGQKLWIRLASALRSDRCVWLLDEPSRFLDIAHESLLWQKINDHCRTGGAVLVASHSSVETWVPGCRVLAVW